MNDNDMPLKPAAALGLRGIIVYHFVAMIAMIAKTRYPETGSYSDPDSLHGDGDNEAEGQEPEGS